MAKAKAPAFVPTDTPQPTTESTGGRAYVPDLGAVTASRPVTRVDAQPPFLLKAHPERWTVMGGKVIPCFGRLVLQPGVGGVASRPNGKIDASDARNMAEQGGWVIVPTDAIPDAHADANGVKSYLYQPEGRPDVTLLRYVRCFPGSAVLEPDEVGYVEFCEHIMDTGVVPRPKAYALEKLRTRMEKEAGALADRARNQSAYTASAAQVAAQLAVVVAAIAEIATRRDAPSLGTAVQVDG